MPRHELCAGALGLVLHHELTGCRRAARGAAALLERLSELPDLDRELRALCERMSERLSAPAPEALA